MIRYFDEQLTEYYPEREVKALARLTFSHHLNYSTTDLVLKSEEGLSESEMLLLMSVVKDLKKQRPIQYILGTTEFYGLEFTVNPSVLIPRPETEELVAWILEIMKTYPNQKANVLDLGTGSGCIAVTLAHHLPLARVVGLDVSEEALQLARANAEQNQAKVEFLHRDILTMAQIGIGSGLDVMVSNPPYVRESEKDEMQPNVLDYEPNIALFVPDDDALIFYRRIKEIALKELVPGGHLFFEINEALGESVLSLFSDAFIENELKTDLSGRVRMFHCRKPV